MPCVAAVPRRSVPVGSAAGNVFRRDIAAGAGFVFENDRRSERFLQRLEKRPGDDIHPEPAGNPMKISIGFDGQFCASAALAPAAAANKVRRKQLTALGFSIGVIRRNWVACRTVARTLRI
jgi:hypothetical protein